MYLTPKESINLMVTKSKNGNGIFTKRNFAAQEIVFEVTGTFISCNEEEDLDEEARSNIYRYDENLYISPKGKIGNFLNHSCNPNAKVSKIGKRLFIFVIKNIPKEKEVTIDYSTIIASDDLWKMKCNCGSSICRKKVGKFNLLPIKLKDKYKTKKIVPEYITKI